MSGTTSPTVNVTITTEYSNMPVNGGVEMSLANFYAGMAGQTLVTSSGTPTSSGSPTSSGGPTSSGTTPPPVTTPPPLLAMPTGITGNAPVTIGTGPDILILQLCYGDPQAINDTFALLLGGVPIAGPLTLTSTTYAGGGTPQVFTVAGDFAGLVPSTGPVLTMQGATTSLNNMSVQSVTYNFVALVTNTNADSRNSQSPNQASVWVSNGAPTLVWTLPVAVSGGGTPPAGGAPPPLPVTTFPDTVISGATINGTAATAGTLQQLVTATPASGVLQLPAGSFYGVATVPVAMTIKGMGMQLTGPGAAVNAGATVINGAVTEGLPLLKAIIVPQAPGVILESLTLTGAAIPSNQGNNGAGVRDSNPATGGGGVGCTLTNVEITGCQDGILSAGSGPWVLMNCFTHGNGAGDGQTHEMYFNGVAGDATNTVTLSNHNSVCGLNSTHALKSRAMVTTVLGGSFTGNPSTDPNEPVAGSVIDTPDGGLVNISGATLVIPSGAQNPIFFGYAEETTGPDNAAAVPAGTPNVTMTSVVFNGNGVAGDIQNGTSVPTATITLSGCTYVGTAGAPKVNQFATVTGTITAAA